MQVRLESTSTLLSRERTGNGKRLSFGTLVALTFLLGVSNLTPALPKFKEVGERMRFSKGRILCVDDNDDSRDLVRFMLQQNGYDVSCVESGREALALVENENFDLLILDNWMPGLTGTEVTQLIRQFDQTTPIIFYTAAAYEGHKKAALDAGAQAYLIKPVGVDALLDEVEKLITKPRSV